MQFVYPLVHCGQLYFWLLWILLLWLFEVSEYLFSIGWYRCGIEILDHMVILCLTFWGDAKPSSTMIVPFDTLTSNVSGYQFLYSLGNVCYFSFLFSLFLFIAILECAVWYLIVVPLSVYGYMAVFIMITY